jgi:hypothetical protein
MPIALYLDSNRIRMQLKGIGINWLGPGDAQTHLHRPASGHSIATPLLYHFLFSVAVGTEIFKGPKGYCEEPRKGFDGENGTPPLECGHRKIPE